MMTTLVTSSLPINSMKKETLLKRLGGEQALRTAVDNFYDRLVNDNELAPFFVRTNMALLKRHQWHFVATLKALNISESLIDEAVSVIAPLRPVFVEGAGESRKRRKLDKK